MYLCMNDSLGLAREALTTAGVGYPLGVDAPDLAVLRGERLVAAIGDDLLRVSIYLSKHCAGVEHGVAMFRRLAATVAASTDFVTARNAAGDVIASGVRSWSPVSDADEGTPVYLVDFYVPMKDGSAPVQVRLSLIVDEDRMLAVDVDMPGGSANHPAAAAIRSWMAAGLAVEPDET